MLQHFIYRYKLNRRLVFKFSLKVLLSIPYNLTKKKIVVVNIELSLYLNPLIFKSRVYPVRQWLGVRKLNRLLLGHGTPPQGPPQESPMLSRTPRVQLTSATRKYITSLRPQPLRSITQCLVDSLNIYALQPLPSSYNIILHLFITNTQPIINFISL